MNFENKLSSNNATIVCKALNKTLPLLHSRLDWRKVLYFLHTSTFVPVISGIYVSVHIRSQVSSSNTLLGTKLKCGLHLLQHPQNAIKFRTVCHKLLSAHMCVDRVFPPIFLTQRKLFPKTFFEIFFNLFVKNKSIAIFSLRHFWKKIENFATKWKECCIDIELSIEPHSEWNTPSTHMCGDRHLGVNTLFAWCSFCKNSGCVTCNKLRNNIAHLFHLCLISDKEQLAKFGSNFVPSEEKFCQHQKFTMDFLWFLPKTWILHALWEWQWKTQWTCFPAWTIFWLHHAEFVCSSWLWFSLHQLHWYLIAWPCLSRAPRKSTNGWLAWKWHSVLPSKHIQERSVMLQVLLEHGQLFCETFGTNSSQSECTTLWVHNCCCCLHNIPKNI